MELFLFLLIVLVACVGGGSMIGKSVGNLFFPEENKNTFVDKSVHHHHHHHEHKNISIIDDKTKEEVIVYQKTISSKK